MRRTLDETWALLEARDEDAPRTEAGTPLVPSAIPHPDDETPGFSFFRTEVTGDYGSLTLPRTFFGRSRIEHARFTDTELAESLLCWNDFVAVDFNGAGLTRADLRASDFERCSFDGADLRGADLRGSHFDRCTFTHARLDGARVERAAAWLVALAETQRTQLELTEDAGDEPEGG